MADKHIDKVQDVDNTLLNIATRVFLGAFFNIISFVWFGAYYLLVISAWLCYAAAKFITWRLDWMSYSNYPKEMKEKLKQMIDL